MTQDFTISQSPSPHSEGAAIMKKRSPTSVRPTATSSHLPTVRRIACGSGFCRSRGRFPDRSFVWSYIRPGRTHGSRELAAWCVWRRGPKWLFRWQSDGSSVASKVNLPTPVASKTRWTQIEFRSEAAVTEVETVVGVGEVNTPNRSVPILASPLAAETFSGIPFAFVTPPSRN